MGSSILSLHTQHVTILSMAGETDKENRRGENNKERKKRYFFFSEKKQGNKLFFFGRFFVLLFVSGTSWGEYLGFRRSICIE